MSDTKKTFYEVSYNIIEWNHWNWRAWAFPLTGIKHRSLKEGLKSLARIRRDGHYKGDKVFEVRLVKSDGENRELVPTEGDRDTKPPTPRPADLVI